MNLCALPVVAVSNTVCFSPGVPIVIPINAENAVRRAAIDLQRDLAVVLDSESPLVTECPTDRASIEILTPDPTLGAPEAHQIRVIEGPGAPPRVTLGGSDLRGVIYAIYSFSEHALGIPPLWFFANWKPTRLPAVELPFDFVLNIRPPHVRWRGWFPNDEDMYAPWEALAANDHFDRILETMLRLKLNIIDLAEIIDYPSTQRLARPRHVHDRGLAMTTTHTSPLGTNWAHWEQFWRDVRHQEPPPLRLDQVKAMEEFWIYQIELCQREGFEMIWEIGFRGNGDHSFANAFPDAPPDAAGRAEVISEMIKIQIALVRARHRNGPLRMRTVLYNENSDYLAAGLLKLPQDPDLIWNYVAARRDHFPAADIRNGDLPANQPYGYYLNLQFTSTGAHLAQAEGPWKIARNYEIAAAVSKRPLELWIVNAGNFREFSREVSAHASIAWTPAGWNADAFLNAWCACYFGAKQASAASGVIRDYYNSYWTQRAPDLPDFPRQYIFYDMRVARACEDLLDTWTEPVKRVALDDRNMGYYRIDPATEKTDDQLTALTRGLSRSIERLDGVTREAAALETELTAQGRRLWRDNVRVQAQVVLATDRALLALVRGYRERSDEAVRRAALEKAEVAFAHARSWLTSADEPPFTGWSAPETLWGINVMRSKITQLLSGEKVTRRDRP